MAVLAPQSITRAGVGPTYAAAAGGGDSFLPDADTFLHVKNGSGGALTVTIVTQNTDSLSNPVADNAVSVPAAGERMIGPFPAQVYANPSTGNADVTYSGVTTLTVAVLKVSKP